MTFKIFRKKCYKLDIYKTWIYACVGITGTNNQMEYKQAPFSSFSNELINLADCLLS